MVELALSELDGADILVNNAGIQYTALCRSSRRSLGRDHRDNLSSAFHSNSAALPKMLQRNWGRIST